MAKDTGLWSLGREFDSHRGYMGILDRFKKKEEQEAEQKQEVPVVGKYEQTCALCSKPGTEKKWMGQYWHKKCMRVAKKGAKRMI